MPMLSGRCFCGAVTWQSDGDMLWRSLCHCEDCRRAASADFVSWFGVHRETVRWSGPRKCYQSSEKAVRSFCTGCGSPLSYETEDYPEETHLYAASLDDPALYKPAAHIFWSERLPWTAESGTLPKFDKGQ